MKKRKVPKYIFTYHHAKDGNGFSHPSICIYEASAYRRNGGGLHYYLGEEVAELRSQCDHERGYDIFKSYALRLEMRMDGFRTLQALKLVSKIASSIDSMNRPLIKAVRVLRKLGCQRYVRGKVRDSENPVNSYEWVPRHFKNKAKAFWDAVDAGIM